MTHKSHVTDSTSSSSCSLLMIHNGRTPQQRPSGELGQIVSQGQNGVSVQRASCVSFSTGRYIPAHHSPFQGESPLRKLGKQSRRLVDAMFYPGIEDIQFAHETLARSWLHFHDVSGLCG